MCSASSDYLEKSRPPLAYRMATSLVHVLVEQPICSMAARLPARIQNGRNLLVLPVSLSYEPLKAVRADRSFR
jgi:hypothetical protein